MLSSSKFFFEIPVDILFSVIAYLINFAQKNQQNNRSLNVWLALNVRVVYNSDSICITGISIIMFQVPTLEPKKHKKSVLSLMKVYKFQFLQKRVSGILYSRCLSTLDRTRSTELTGYGSSHQRCSIKKDVLRNVAKFT